MTRYIFKDETSSEVYCSPDLFEDAIEVECSTDSCVDCINCKHIKKLEVAYES